MGESHSHWALGSPFFFPSQPVDSKLTKTQMCHQREEVLTSAICICWRGMRTLNVCLWQPGRAGTTTSLYLKPLLKGFYLNQVRKLHHLRCGFPKHNTQTLTTATSPRTAFLSPLAILLIVMSGAIKRHSTRACLSFWSASVFITMAYLMTLRKCYQGDYLHLAQCC